jgi:dTMP kinase
MEDPKSMTKGHFIVFEGIDNSGKTTVAKVIHKWLSQEKKIRSVLTRHPGSTPIGKDIRSLLKHSPHPINPNAQALLFAADNSLFTHQLLLPHLTEGTWVLGDRDNFISSLAYQIASGCSVDELLKVHAATERPKEAMIDLLFIFHCGWEETRRRKAHDLAKTGQKLKVDRYEDEGKEYFNKLVHCYEHLHEQKEFDLTSYVRSNDRLKFINVERPLDEVIETVKGHLETYIVANSEASNNKKIENVNEVDPVAFLRR